MSKLLILVLAVACALLWTQNRSKTQELETAAAALQQAQLQMEKLQAAAAAPPPHAPAVNSLDAPSATAARPTPPAKGSSDWFRSRLDQSTTTTHKMAR